jgi:hypothetical protein
MSVKNLSKIKSFLLRLFGEEGDEEEEVEEDWWLQDYVRLRRTW